MSWIYCVLVPERSHTVNSAPVHARPLKVVIRPGFYLALGGNAETCLVEESENQEKGWAVVGLGISSKSDRAHLASKSDWSDLLTRSKRLKGLLDGHFVVIRWDGPTVEFFTDDLGLRTLYFGNSDGGTCLSTRLDWVTRTTKRNEIDFASLGSLWLMVNQLEYQSCMTGVSRLGPGGYLRFQGAMLCHQESSAWLPDFGNGDISPAIDILSSFLWASLRTGKPISLGLSGGFDSRLLLAMLTEIADGKFGVYTFGDPSDPDVVTSSAIANELGLDRMYFDEPLPDAGSLASESGQYAVEACLVEPISSFLKLRYYPELGRQGKLMIDGGFGEIARRQYLNRVAKLGKVAIRDKDPLKLFRLMRVNRADIFTEDVNGIMKHGAVESLGRVLNELPDVTLIGLENCLDLLAVRTRIPNYGSPAQARLDSEVLNFMPFVQPSFMRAVFATRSSLRQNARGYRDLIDNKSKILTKLPLVKSGTQYRFWASTTESWITAKVKSKLGRSFADKGSTKFLTNQQEHVMDLAHSADVMTWPAYDIRKIQGAVRQFYREGRSEFSSTVDWWLTFEKWRRGLTS